MKRVYESKNRNHKLNVSTKFISLIFLICLLQHFVTSNDTNPDNEQKNVKLYEKPASINDSPIENNENQNSTKKYTLGSLDQNEAAPKEVENTQATPNTSIDLDEFGIRTKSILKDGDLDITANPLKEDEDNDIDVTIHPDTFLENDDDDKAGHHTKFAYPTRYKSSNQTIFKRYDDDVDILCDNGLILRTWQPLQEVSHIEQILRGVVYFFAMCYLFVGVYIASNRFMESIEVITSNEKEITVINNNGKKEIILVRVWNDTVANLTLMALGSSTPEIFLSVIEMFQKNFVAGSLGPGTILGSAAYNLFVIIAVCIVAIPKGQVRKIQKYRVFIVTALWSIFAYVWLCLITKYITPNVIDIWEGLLTLLFFPILVYHAYITERRLFCASLYGNHSKTNQRGDVVNTNEYDQSNKLRSSIKNLIDMPEMRNFEESRREYIIKLKELHRKYPHYDLERIEIMAQDYLIKRSNKSRAFYRIQSGRRIMGGPNLLTRVRDHAIGEIGEARALMHKNDYDEDEIDVNYETRIHFAPSHYTVMEGAGYVKIHVIRVGNIMQQSKVEYYTEDGTAEAGSDYVAVRDVLIFAPGVAEQIIKIKILDDDIIENDEHFYVYLKNPSEGAVIVSPKVATVMIFDDDHCGIFGFTERVHRIPETIKIYELKVKRFTGARGKVIVPYYSTERSAISGKDYEDVHGQLEFQNGEVEKTITIKIHEEHSLEKDAVFEVCLGQPKLAEDDPLQAKINEAQRKPEEQRSDQEKLQISALPALAKFSIAECHIIESTEFTYAITKLVQTANSSKLVGTTSYKQQFMDALTLSGRWTDDADDDDDIADDDGVNKPLEHIEQGPSSWEYVSYFVTLFWKICFVVIPPAKMCNGYPCFIISLFVLGICTALIADLAFHFGCTLGVPDFVTAICFVALGTSLPDTFASGIAAIHESTADNAIGNVTGSNAVNVFLGIGIAWTIAAIYHAYHGNEFLVPVGSLLFSTTLFIGEAFIAFFILLWRRSKSIGGELGGPVGMRWFHCTLYLTLWFAYLIFSILEVYGVIRGF